MLDNEQSILSIKRVCDLLDMSRGTAQKLIDSGKLEAIRYEKAVDIPKSFFLRYLEKEGQLQLKNGKVVQKKGDTNMLDEYPDILDVEEVQEILGISYEAVLRLLQSKEIKNFRPAYSYRILKMNLISYMIQASEEEKTK